MRKLKILLTIFISVLLVIVCNDVSINQYQITKDYISYYPLWDHSNNRIFFWGYHESNPSLAGIWTVDNNGENPVLLFNTVSISPNGSLDSISLSEDNKLVFTFITPANQSGIYYIDIDNPEEFHFITDGNYAVVNGNLIDGDDNIAFSKIDGEYYSIYLTDLSQTEPQILLTGDMDFLYPYWSPDGSELVYVKSDNSDHSICRYNIASQQEETIYKNSNLLFLPKFSPDANWIAFIMQGIETGYFEVFKISVNGETLEQITEFPYPGMEVPGTSYYSFGEDSKQLILGLHSPPELWIVDRN
jgi:Tol biopolymer transport system component